MALETTPIVVGTIPYPDFTTGQIMHDFLFDENNAALLTKINELVVAINNITSALSSVSDTDSGADNIAATPIEGLLGNSVQEIMESLDAQTREAVFGALLLPKYTGTIAVTDWEVVEGDFGYQATIIVDGISNNDVPLVGVMASSEVVASESEFSTIVNSYDGGLIFKSKRIPTDVIAFHCLMVR